MAGGGYFQLQSTNKIGGDVGLNLKDVARVAVVGFRPTMSAIASIDKLCGYARVVTRPVHASFYYISCTERRADRPQIVGLSFEPERRRASDHFQFRDRHEQIQNLLGHSVTEVLLIM